MNKEKRKLYKIKEMKRKELSYIERGNKISEMKANSSVNYLDSMTTKERKQAFERKSITTTEPKVVEEIKQTKIMPEKIKKLLFVLPADKLWARVIRRGIVVAILTFVAIILKDWLMPIAPEVWVAVIGAVLIALDKTIRELIGK